METYTLASPPEPAATPPIEPNPADKPQSFVRKNMKFFIIGGVLLGFLLMFLLGASLNRPQPVPSSDAKQGEEEAQISESPNVTVAVTPQQSNSVMQYLPGKTYTEESLAIVTKSEPYRVMYASVAQLQQQKNYTQIAKVTFYNGKSWDKQTVTTAIEKPQIVTNPLIRAWKITPATPVFNGTQTVQATLTNQPLTFTLRSMSTDMSVQALPAYTKITYFAEGTLQTNTGTQEAYAIYTKTTSSNASDVAFFNNPEQLTGTWLVFWDKAGNMYHLDTLTSEQHTNPLQNYRIGLERFSDDLIAKTNQVDFQRGENNQYITQFPSPRNTTLTTILSAPYTKASTPTFSWQSGIITGVAKTATASADGVGLIELMQKIR